MGTHVAGLRLGWAESDRLAHQPEAAGDPAALKHRLIESVPPHERFVSFHRKAQGVAPLLAMPDQDRVLQRRRDECCEAQGVYQVSHGGEDTRSRIARLDRTLL